MSIRSNPTGSTRGFTVVELLVVLATTGLLVAILIPALSLAREQAAKAACQSTLRGNASAIYTYATDNNQLMPPINPACGDNTTMTDLNNHNAYLASWAIWGCRTQTWVAGYATAKNQALGMGIVVQADYSDLTSMYCPKTRYDGYMQLRRSDYNYLGVNYQAITIPPFIAEKQMPVSVSQFPTWRRRVAFGLPLMKPYPLSIDDQAWWPTSSTAAAPVSPNDDNIELPCTYSYRSGDYCVYTSSSNTISAGGGGAFRGYGMLKVNRPGFAKKSLIIDYIDANHLQLSGANVAFGDGSVTFWSEPNMWKYFTDFRGAGRGGYWGNMPSATLGVPQDATAFGAGTAPGAAYQSFAFAVADAKLR